MIKLIRLDYRLLHGQVVFAWCGFVNAQRIIIIDDETANDEFKKSAISLSKPASVKLNIFTLETALKKMPKVENLNENIIVIFGKTSQLRMFCEQYDKVSIVNYGGLANTKQSKQYASAIFMEPSEVEDTKKILSLGVKIYVQQTPSLKIEEMDLNN